MGQPHNGHPENNTAPSLMSGKIGIGILWAGKQASRGNKMLRDAPRIVMTRGVIALFVILTMFSAPVIAGDLPFGAQISPADRELVIKTLGPDFLEDVNPKTDLDIAKIDLNGDGRPDYIAVIHNSLNCGSAGCPTFVYLSKDTHYLNALPDLLAQGIALGTGSTRGVRDLELNLRHESGTSRWAWNGKVYRPAVAGPTK